MGDRLVIKNSIRATFGALGYTVSRRSVHEHPAEASSDQCKIIEFVRPYTMTSDDRIWAALAATTYIAKNQIPGSFVECGVWRGGTAMAIAMQLALLEVFERQIELYDTFEGMTLPSDKDVERASKRSAGSMFERKKREEGRKGWCYSSKIEVETNLRSIDYPFDRFCLVQGDVMQTLQNPKSGPIALLRLDTDWYESTKFELNQLYPRLSKGGVCIVDDYGHWEGARRAVDEYLFEHEISPLMTKVDYSGRMWIKN